MSLMQAMAQGNLGKYEVTEQAPGFAGVILDGFKKDEYKNYATYSEVPVADRAGGIPGKPMSFGIIPGRQFVFDEELQTYVDKGPVQFEASQEPVKSAVEQMTFKGKRGKALQEILDPKSKKSKTITATEVAEATPEVKVTLQGGFGKFVGKYVDVIQDNELVVLCQDIAESGFTPQQSEDDTVQLTWTNPSTGVQQSVEVYYLGLTFEVTSVSTRFFIFHLGTAE